MQKVVKCCRLPESGLNAARDERPCQDQREKHQSLTELHPLTFLATVRTADLGCPFPIPHSRFATPFLQVCKMSQNGITLPSGADHLKVEGLLPLDCIGGWLRLVICNYRSTTEHGAAGNSGGSQKGLQQRRRRGRKFIPLQDEGALRSQQQGVKTIIAARAVQGADQLTKVPWWRAQRREAVL